MTKGFVCNRYPFLILNMVKYFIKQGKKKDNITVYRLDHKGDVGCSQNVSIFVFYFWKWHWRNNPHAAFYFKIKATALPSPPPPKKGVPTEVKLSKPAVAHF